MAENDNYSLILVGGTGQRIGLMLGYLNVLGLAAVPKYTVVIDADDQHREQLTRLLKFGNPDAVVSYQKPFASSATDTKVSSLVRSVNSKFWDICMELGDRDMPIDQGFYARPQVASVVFNASMAQPDEFPLFSAITKGISQAGGSDSVIVIAGSISGGTGAGIIPTLARQLKHDDKKVVGLLLTRYFRVSAMGEGGTEKANRSYAPDNDMLEANSNAGLEHIRGLLKQRDCPFNAVYLLGHHPAATLSEACGHDEFQPHAFPGFLAAASLLADGSREIDARILASQTNDGGERPKLYLFPCGPAGRLDEDQVPVKIPDLGLPVARAIGADASTPTLGASTLRQALRVAKDAVADFSAAPFAASLGLLATFPRQRLTGAVYDTLVERSALSQGEAKLLEKAVQDAAAIHSVAVEGMRKWFAGLSGWKETSSASTAVQATTWRKAIRRQDRESDLPTVAQRWVQAISSSQIVASNSAAPSPVEGKDFLLPLQTTGGHAAEPCVPQEVSPDIIEASPAAGEAWQKLSRSFARPDGRREAFSLAVHKGRVVAARDFEWELWQFLAAGLVGLEVVDCLAGPHDGFDRTMYQSSGQRFHLRLHAADRVALGLGGLTAGDGIWPAVLTDQVQKAFDNARNSLLRRAWELKGVQDIANPTVGLRAAIVLRLWCEDMADQSQGNLGLPWFRSLQERAEQTVNRACQESGGRVSWEQLRDVMQNHLGTVGPMLVELGGRSVPIYMYQFDDFRRYRVLLLQRGLDTGALQRGSGDGITVGDQGDPVARLQLAVPPPRKGQDVPSGEDVVLSGYGRLRFTGALPMDLIPSGARSPWSKWPSLVRFSQDAYDQMTREWHETRQSTPPPTSPFATDLFWNVVRPSAASEVVRG